MNEYYNYIVDNFGHIEELIKLNITIKETDIDFTGIKDHQECLCHISDDSQYVDMQDIIVEDIILLDSSYDKALKDIYDFNTKYGEML